jgi:hypothetical protein
MNEVELDCSKYDDETNNVFDEGDINKDPFDL